MKNGLRARRIAALIVALAAILALAPCLAEEGGEFDFIGAWYLVKLDYGYATYDPSDVGYEAVYAFIEDGTLEFSVNGAAGTAPWRAEGGMPVMVIADAEYPFERRGDFIAVEYGGAIQIFGRDRELGYDGGAADAAAVAAERDAEGAEARFDAGVALFGESRFAEAIAEFTAAIGLDPGNERPYAYRAASYYYMKEYGEAAVDYAAAMALNPTNATYANGSGNANHALKDYAAAVAEYSKAIALAPDNERYYANRGNSYYLLKDYVNALADYRIASDMNPSEASYFNYIGMSYYGLLNYEDALTGFESAAALDPGNESYAKNVASVKALLEADQAQTAKKPSETYKGSPLGSAKILEGKALLVTIFVDVGEHKWAWEDFEAIRRKYELTKEFLEAEARRYGKELELIYDFEADTDLMGKITAPDDYFAAFESLSAGGAGVSAGDATSLARFLTVIKQLNEFIEGQVPYQALCDRYGTDSIVYCFQSRKWAPANYEFLYNPDLLPETSTYHEKFIMFDASRWGAEAMAHEILHAFGAVDLYIPSPVNGVAPELVEYAREHFNRDIMGNWDDARVQDSIPYEIGRVTAYGLGWLDDIPELAMFPDLRRTVPAAFYDHTRHVDDGLKTHLTIPGSGGVARVDGITMFEFVPDHTDLWVMASSDCGPSKVWIELYNEHMVSLGRSRMGGSKTSEGGSNVTYVCWLEAGVTYYIEATFVEAGVGDNAKGGYALTLSNPEALPGGGGVGEHIDGGRGYYYLTPDASGEWEIVSADFGGEDVYYTLYETAEDDGKTHMFGPYYVKVGQGRQPKSEGTEERIVARLEAGRRYLLELSSIEGKCSYTVTVRMK